MTGKAPKRPRDTNQLAKSVVDIATGQHASDRAIRDKEKDPAASSLGRRGGLKGGDARARVLSKERRAEIARTAAKKRWGQRGTESDK